MASGLQPEWLANFSFTLELDSLTHPVKEKRGLLSQAFGGWEWGEGGRSSSIFQTHQSPSGRSSQSTCALFRLKSSKSRGQQGPFLLEP